MALNDEKKPESSDTASTPPDAPSKPTSASRQADATGKIADDAARAGAPLAITVAFLAGLVVLYLGQRVVLKWEGVATGLSWLGMLGLVGATIARFAPALRGRGEHARVARLLDGLQVLGLVAVGMFFLTTERGAALFGLQGHEHASTVLLVSWVICVSVSVVGLVFAEFALHPMRSAHHVEVRRVRAAAISGATLALTASYGSLLVYAAAQQEAQADFSYFKTSQPGEATVKLVQKAGKPIQVTAFFPKVSDVRKEVEGYLSALAKQTGNVEVKIADRYLEPALAKEMNVVSDGAIVLTQEDGSETINVGTKMDKARAKLMKFDSEFYGKLSQLINSRKTAYFTVGHGELNDPQRGTERQDGRSANVVKTLLERQNYRVKNLGLGQGLGKAVPDDADVVLVLGPTVPFAPEEIQTLHRYADAGGRVFMALDADSLSPSAMDSGASGTEPQAAPTSSAAAAASAAPQESEAPPSAEPAAPPGGQWLVDLAAAVGAKLMPTVLADAQNYVVRLNQPSDRVIMPTNRFSSHASVSTLSRNSSRAGVVVMGASYLLDDEGPMGKPNVPLRSMASSFEDANRDFNQSAGEMSKSYNLAVALSKQVARADSDKSDAPTTAQGTGGAANAAAEPQSEEQQREEGAASDGEETDEKNPDEMRAFVLADADALSDLLMERVVGNQMLLVDAVRWLVGEESLAGAMESEEDVRIEHTKQQDQVWFYVTIFGVPALVLALGLLISRRGRSRDKARAVTPSIGSTSGANS